MHPQVVRTQQAEEPQVDGEIVDVQMYLLYHLPKNHAKGVSLEFRGRKVWGG